MSQLGNLGSIPLVSVVMPTLQQAAFIEASIDSVLSQSYANIELIVADGGSADGTQEILRNRAAQDHRLRWFSEKDNGPAQALNRALKKVRGTIIGWLNSDDLYTPHAIDHAVAALVRHPKWMMLYGEAEHVDVAGKVINRYPTLPPSTPLQHFSNGCFICQPTVFFRLRQFLLLGELDESLKTAFDFDYWMRAFRAYPGQIGFVDRIQAQSRLHKDCITLRQRKKALIEGVQVLARHLGSAPPEWVLTYVDEISSELALEFLTEVRGCLRPEDEAQLLEKFGRSVLSEQAGNISMPTSQAISEFNLLRFILVIRHDLREKHGFDLESNLNRYLGWVLQAGLGEYRALAENIPLIQALIARGGGNSVGLTPLQYLTWLQRPDVQGTFPLPEKRHDFLIWFYSHGPREHFLWDFMTTNERAPIEQLPEVQKARLISMVRRLAHTAPIPVPSAPLPFGVNVVGYAFGQLGIGEDGRMAARALLAAKVPCAMLDFPPGDDIQKNDRSMAAHVVEVANFSFNLFCLTAEENGRFYAEKGGSQFLGRYNIGYWPWELSQWPKDWGTILNLVDEVWVSTQHTYDALSPVCDKPLFLMPLAVDLGEITAFPTRHTARLHFGLPETAKLFCFAFDLNSSVDRKNPQACVDAFLAAFPTDQFSVDDVSLVIKVHKPKQHNAAWERLKLLAAQDSRIHIIEATLTRPDLLALYQACDCFISLHRAEGYGRGLAEAMQLGLHIICTGYSGNVDFCKPPFADLVNYTLVPLTAQQYPHSTGQVWAEPDVSHAASLMRAFVLDGHTPPSQQDWPQFSVNTLGEVYKKRLLEIWAG